MYKKMPGKMKGASKGKTGTAGHLTPHQAPVKNKVTKKGTASVKKAGPVKTASMVHSRKVTKKAVSVKKAAK